MRSYEPGEFVSLLASNQLDEPPLNLAIYGSVKADENDSHVLLFSISTSCDQWIRIPLSQISSIQHGGSVSCKDHRHPFVRIMLTEANKEDLPAALFMRLFVEEKAKAVAARANALCESGGCGVFEFDGVPYVCYPPASGSGPWDCYVLS